MFNLLNGDFYKLFKSKAFYISCIVAVASAAFIYVMLIIANKIQSGELENGTAGFIVVENENRESNVPELNEIGILDVLQQMFSNFGSFVVAVFAAVFVIGDYTNGAVKNVAGKGYARGKIFVSKYISTTSASVIMMVLMAAATVICGILVGKEQKIDGELLGQMCLYTGVQILIGAALCGVIVTISELCRTLGAGIAIGFAVAGFSQLITAAMDMAVQVVLPQSDFRFSAYWLLNLIMECPITDISKDFIMRAVGMSVIWSLIALGVGSLHFKKADIK